MFLRTRLSGYYFALFIMIGLYVPYLPVWLQNKGLSGEQIGLVLATALWAKVPTSILTTALSDLWGRRKTLVCILSFSIAVGFYSFYFLNGVFALALGWGLVGALLTAAIPLGDNISLLAVRRHGLDFGRLRLWGSLSFITMSLLGGAYLSRYSDDANAVLHLLLGGAVIFVLVTFTLPSFTTERPKGQRLPMFAPFRIPSFWIFLLSAAPILASHAALYGFATVHWRSLGIADDVIGLLWAEGVIAEVLVFVFGKNLLQRYSPALLLCLAATIASIRWAVIGWTDQVTILAIAQLGHAFSFAMTYVAAQAYLIRTIPDQFSGSAQGLYDAIAMGLIFGIAMSFAGWIFESYGSASFYAMIPFTLCAALASFFGLRHFEKAEKTPS